MQMNIQTIIYLNCGERYEDIPSTGILQDVLGTSSLLLKTKGARILFLQKNTETSIKIS